MCSLKSCCQMEIAVMIPNPIDSFGCWSEAEARAMGMSRLVAAMAREASPPITGRAARDPL